LYYYYIFKNIALFFKCLFIGNRTAWDCIHPDKEIKGQSVDWQFSLHRMADCRVFDFTPGPFRARPGTKKAGLCL